MLPMSILSDFLNRKFVEWQAKEGRRKTIDHYAAFIGVSRPLLSMWMSGTKNPGPENKKRLIALYGDEAVVAFGEDPDLYALQQNWNLMTPEKRRKLRAESDENAKQNIERSSKKRRISTTE